MTLVGFVPGCSRLKCSFVYAVLRSLVRTDLPVVLFQETFRMLKFNFHYRHLLLLFLLLLLLLLLLNCFTRTGRYKFHLIHHYTKNRALQYRKQKKNLSVNIGPDDSYVWTLIDGSWGAFVLGSIDTHPREITGVMCIVWHKATASSEICNHLLWSLASILW